MSNIYILLSPRIERRTLAKVLNRAEEILNFEKEKKREKHDYLVEI